MHQAVLFGVLGVLVLWSLIGGKFVFSISLLWWLLGSVLGFMFVFCDRIIYSIVSNPERTLSVKLKELLVQNKIIEGAKLLLAEKYEQKELVMRNFLFLVVWIVLAFFTVTSVTNSFGRGLVLGIGIHLIFDLIWDFAFDKERMDQWFWQIKRTLEPEEKKLFVFIVSVLFVLVAINL